MSKALSYILASTIIPVTACLSSSEMRRPRAKTEDCGISKLYEEFGDTIRNFGGDLLTNSTKIETRYIRNSNNPGFSGYVGYNEEGLYVREIFSYLQLESGVIQYGLRNKAASEFPKDVQAQMACDLAAKIQLIVEIQNSTPPPPSPRGHPHQLIQFALQF